MIQSSSFAVLPDLVAPLRLAFVGTGWIGRHRMQAIVGTGIGRAAVICDPAHDMRSAALEAAPGAFLVSDFERIFDHPLDGVVIATPSAQHAAQSIAALQRGIPVFCQKPLGRTAGETKAAVDAAARADRLLSVDLSYRQTTGMQRIRELVQEGELGDVFAVDMVFHNAYGPDKPWFYDPRLSGGGCVVDLGVHLVDLALWALGFPQVVDVQSSLFLEGRPFDTRSAGVEDAAWATLVLETGAIVRIACSWRLHAGQDAMIACNFHGTRGGASFCNRNGSFYDFGTQRMTGTTSETLHDAPEEWGGKAAGMWVKRLAEDRRFDPEARELVAVATVLDRIYGRRA